MSKLIPLFVFVLFSGLGAFAGLQMQGPSDSDVADDMADSEEEKTTKESPETEASTELVKLNNQFIIPVIDDDTVASLVVVSLGIEIASSQAGTVFSLEPKLRDAFLQVLFNHANIGGFDAAFTNSRNMNFLREALLSAGQSIAGDGVYGVFITDLARQDVQLR